MSKAVWGTVLGFLVGGPAGAAMGAAAGAAMDRDEQSRATPRGPRRRLGGSRLSEIRQLVQEAVGDEAREHRMRAVGRAKAGPQADVVTDFLVRYVESVPDALEQFVSSAAGTPFEDQVRGVMYVIEEYFLDPDDLIPDAEGVSGLLDDAYLSYRILERILGSLGADTNQIERANDLVETVFDADVREALNERVEETFDQPSSQSVVSSLQAQAAMGRLAMRYAQQSQNLQHLRQMQSDTFKANLYGQVISAGFNPFGR